jgi:hypothetical protein
MRTIDPVASSRLGMQNCGLPYGMNSRMQRSEAAVLGAAPDVAPSLGGTGLDMVISEESKHTPPDRM